MPYLVALVLVAAFTANVVFGAVGQERFVGNVGEMLILFAAAISFSVGILLASAERRNFLKLASTGSFTAALVAGAGGMLWSDQAAAQTAAEERDREAAAEHIMTLATAYVLGASRSYPIMQLDLKENIQNMTNGKVYVRLAPGGQLGAGGALAQAVQGGTIQCAQHSLANFAPFASVVDLINLPYFCGSNQRFTNLTSSDTWKSEVDPKIAASGFKALFYIVIDPRVVAVRQGGNAIITPGDMAGVKFRVPGSAMLQQYYRMVGANPTPVAWGETPSAIRRAWPTRSTRRSARCMSSASARSSAT
jgi:TRAP-type C4-dicarboxylate transport system substrate-binding protein